MLNLCRSKNINYIEFTDLTFPNLQFNKNLTRGINVIISENYSDIFDDFKFALINEVQSLYKETSRRYSQSLIYNETDKEIIKNYKNYINIDNNICFRRFFNSLIDQHKKFLINKYGKFSKLKNFYLFPASDLNFICFLYSLSIISSEKPTIIPLISDNFFEIFDNLTLTSACKLLLDFNKNINFQFITFINSNSNFISEYSKFYDFNYINLWC